MQKPQCCSSNRYQCSNCDHEQNLRCCLPLKCQSQTENGCCLCKKSQCCLSNRFQGSHSDHEQDSGCCPPLNCGGRNGKAYTNHANDTFELDTMLSQQVNSNELN